MEIIPSDKPGILNNVVEDVAGSAVAIGKEDLAVIPRVAEEVYRIPEEVVVAHGARQRAGHLRSNSAIREY